MEFVDTGSGAVASRISELPSWARIFADDDSQTTTKAGPRRKRRVESIVEFVSEAKAFHRLIWRGAPSAEDLAVALSSLHTAFLRLPDVEPEADAPEAISPNSVTNPLAGLTLPFDAYSAVFNPLDMPREAPVENSLYVDILDICRDLLRGLDLFEQRFPLAACWVWRFSFFSHWGEHLTGAQRALYHYIRDGQK